MISLNIIFSLISLISAQSLSGSYPKCGGNGPQPVGCGQASILRGQSHIGIPAGCFSKVDPGPCSQDLVRIYFDSKTYQCRTFSYSGCGGNTNRFLSIKNCYKLCHPYYRQRFVTLGLDSGSTAPQPGHPPSAQPIDSAANEANNEPKPPVDPHTPQVPHDIPPPIEPPAGPPHSEATPPSEPATEENSTPPPSETSSQPPQQSESSQPTVDPGEPGLMPDTNFTTGSEAPPPAEPPSEPSPPSAGSEPPAEPSSESTPSHEETTPETTPHSESESSTETHSEPAPTEPGAPPTSDIISPETTSLAPGEMEELPDTNFTTGETGSEVPPTEAQSTSETQPSETTPNAESTPGSSSESSSETGTTPEASSETTASGQSSTTELDRGVLFFNSLNGVDLEDEAKVEDGVVKPEIQVVHEYDQFLPPQGSPPYQSGDRGVPSHYPPPDYQRPPPLLLKMPLPVNIRSLASRPRYRSLNNSPQYGYLANIQHENHKPDGSYITGQGL